MESPYFSEELNLLRDQIRRFIDEEVKPYADQWEEDGMVPREVLKAMGDLGFFGLKYGEEYGGSNADTLASVVLAEELGHSTYGGFSATVLVHTDMASPHLANAGNKEQLRKYLPPIISGDHICAIAVTEPNAGSDVAGLQTKAVKDGDDWVINGSKMFITNGIHADVFFVAARTDMEAKGSRGITNFIVEKGTPGQGYQYMYW